MYQLHSCIKIWIIPKASFGTSNDFVCEFCTKTFGFGERMKNHICCLHLPEIWTILKGALKNHIYCNHAKIFELFPKASFGISNDFVSEFCTKTFGLVERMKNHICCLHVPEIWTILKGEGIVSIAIMQNILNCSRRQVLVFQMILYANFAVLLSNLLREWRAIWDNMTLSICIQ